MSRKKKRGRLDLHAAIRKLSADSAYLFDLINKEPDMACAVVGVAYLDEVLEKMLRTRLKPGEAADRLLSPRGALGTFGARLDVLHCLGAVHGPDYGDLALLAKIRNRFAHSHLQLTFDDPDVQAFCDDLLAWRFLYTSDYVHPVPATKEARRLHARGIFNLTTAFLAHRLLIAAIDTVGPPS